MPLERHPLRNHECSRLLRFSSALRVGCLDPCSFTGLSARSVSACVGERVRIFQGFRFHFTCTEWIGSSKGANHATNRMMK